MNAPLIMYWVAGTDMPTSSSFVERLSDLMIEHNETSPHLADALGIHRTTVTRYLAGKKTPSLQNIVSFANYFNCTSDYLLGIDEQNYFTAFKPCPSFDKQFANLLNHFNMSKAELHRKTDIAESLIYDWLRGKCTPSIYNIIKLADAFECSVDYVLGRGN